MFINDQLPQIFDMNLPFFESVWNEEFRILELNDLVRACITDFDSMLMAH